jgi:hypothetical protein
MLTINPDDEHILNLRVFRGTVISTTVAPKPGLPTTMHILLNDGIQKSIDVSSLDVSCIQGNEIFWISTDDDKIVYLKNFASNDIQFANADSGNSGGGFAVLLFILGCYMWLNFSNSGPIDRGLSQFGGWLIVASLCWIAIAIKARKSRARKTAKFHERLLALCRENGIAK